MCALNARKWSVHLQGAHVGARAAPVPGVLLLLLASSRLRSACSAGCYDLLCCNVLCHVHAASNDWCNIHQWVLVFAHWCMPLAILCQISGVLVCYFSILQRAPRGSAAPALSSAWLPQLCLLITLHMDANQCVLRATQGGRPHRIAFGEAARVLVRAKAGCLQFVYEAACAYVLLVCAGVHVAGAR